MSAPPSPGAARKVILDCDPGIDDAFAIAFGCGHPGLELCGVTTVTGNVGLGKTTHNALAVLEFLGRADVPVAAGSPAPLLRPFTEAHDVHGVTGLGAASLPEPSGRPVAAHAVDFLIERIAAAPGEVTLVATGPLTNIALAVRRYPPLVSQVADFVIMGGSAGRGNTTPAAEFNIWCDPEAAARCRSPRAARHPCCGHSRTPAPCTASPGLVLPACPRRARRRRRAHAAMPASRRSASTRP